MPVAKRPFVGGAPNTTYLTGTYGGSFVIADNDYIQSDSAPPAAGMSDAKTFLFSCWVRKTGSDAIDQRIFSSTGFKAGLVGFDTSNRVQVYVKNAAAANIVIGTAGTITVDGLWHHVAVSFDTGTAANKAIYIDGVDASATFTTFTADGLVNYSGVNFWRLGSDTNGTSDLAADLAEVYLTSPSAYFDLSTGISKFIVNGQPADLGADGSTPTGVQPYLYLSGTLSSISTNLGSKGTYTAGTTISLTDGPRTAG